MSKLLNTTYQDTVEKVTNFYSDLVNNPFYQWNDKKPTISTYYNINKDYSSLDPGSKLYMNNIGSESPIRYNKISNMILFGFNRIELQNSLDEFGLESEKISGECFILPNTITPMEGDYFEIDHITDSTWLFMVNDVQKDTLDNGSNAYKISYRLEYINHDDILSKIVHNFESIEVKDGTNVTKIVRCEDYDIAKIMDEKAVMLKQYYLDLFYNEKVQSFTYIDISEFRTYDPYMIEFLTRNKILDNSEDNYIHVTHQIPVSKTFSLDYDRTFFRVFEKNQKEKILTCNSSTYLEMIVSYGTTFSARYEEYFKAEYGDTIRPGFTTSCIDVDIFEHISDNKLYDDNIWKNIYIKYFNHDTFSKEEVESIDEIEFKYSKDAFYIIPTLIFCLEKCIENVLK